MRECHQTFRSVSIKKKRELRTAAETTKLTLTSEPNYQSHFIKYATTLYNEVPKSIQEAEKILRCCS